MCAHDSGRDDGPEQANATKRKVKIRTFRPMNMRHPRLFFQGANGIMASSELESFASPRANYKPFRNRCHPPVVGSLLVNFVTRGGTSEPRRIVWGICLGLLLPVVGGYAWMKIDHSFESPPLFWGGVILSIPSAIGGGLAGWIQSRARVRSPGMDQSSRHAGK